MEATIGARATIRRCERCRDGRTKRKAKGIDELHQTACIWIDKHNEIKDKLVEIWSFDDNYFEAVMNNWNSRYLYMNNQYKKRLSYLKALQKAMGSVQF